MRPAPRAYVCRVRQIRPPAAGSVREPVFNVPDIIAGIALALIGIHAIRTWLLGRYEDVEVITYFAFIPVRYALEDASLLEPGGLLPRVWTFVTYALLHASWLHLVVNLVWLLAFGTPVARRFGSARFAVFFAVTAAGGALAHYLSYPEGTAPLVGASGAISGTMAGAVRFMFQPGGALSGRNAPFPDHQPAGTLVEIFSDRRALIFVAAFFGLNLLFGLGFGMPGAEEAEVAWQAHLGGFLAGLLLFPLFDPIPRRVMPA